MCASRISELFYSLCHLLLQSTAITTKIHSHARFFRKKFNASLKSRYKILMKYLMSLAIVDYGLVKGLAITRSNSKAVCICHKPSFCLQDKYNE